MELHEVDFRMLEGGLVHLLKKSSPSRIINVASDYHRLGQVGNVGQMARGVNMLTNPTAIYGNAKLALCMTTVALADRLRGTGVELSKSLSVVVQ
ncbi:hypothetical protein HPB52_025053 [Rhipicephalus sanguineus]|uniref:Uncharacterized protein n=1 Tax=Rhipicephalus sanguineus TaxID=34632 RepID=A0A9D4SMJ5_RHISA|nr:hypothetical protein HPB52_025053 [Rhipicephalus sanguineus]